MKIGGKIFWVIFCMLLWITGLIIFIINCNSGVEYGWLLGFIIWGAFCSICTIKSLMSSAIAGGKEGRKQGANDFTVTDKGSHYVVQNHPLRGAIIGFIGGLLGGFIIGPIVVPINTIRDIIVIVRISKEAKN